MSTFDEFTVCAETFGCWGRPTPPTSSLRPSGPSCDRPKVDEWPFLRDGARKLPTQSFRFRGELQEFDLLEPMIARFKLPPGQGDPLSA